ncbi:MAG: polyketide cyclase [Actinobacteria bacterium]|nr:polyketide cyclase [Actinomycetota bacterium]
MSDQVSDQVGTATRIEAQRSVAASPATIFEIICDPQGQVDIDASGMLMSADGDPVRGVGDTYVVHMDREALGDMPLGTYEVVPEIVGFERDRYLEWKINSLLDPPFGHTYGYTLEADPEHPERTIVTSFCDWRNMHELYVGKVAMPIVSQASLRASLGILDRLARRREGAR